jgi:hypothetical protein
MSAAERNSEASKHTTGAVILDLGKRKRKRIKDLKDGKGKLFNEVLDALEELRAAGTIAQDAQPVIVIVGEKQEGLLPKIGL